MLQRIWTRGGTDEFVIWDLGNEFWEMRNDSISHYSLISRTEQQGKIIEILELLLETPIPLEAIRKDVIHWTVLQEKLLHPSGSLEQPGSLEKPVKIKQESLNKKKMKNKKSEDQESCSSDYSQSSYNHPQKLFWSSLSQWIPPSALFQPSLHHQVFLELSDIPVKIFLSPSPKIHRKVQGQHFQRVKETRPCHQKAPSPSNTGPLFL